MTDAPFRWRALPDPVTTGEGGGHGPLRTVLELAIPLAVAGLLVRVGRPVMAGVVVTIGLGLFVATRVSPAARSAIDRFFARLAGWIGEVLTLVVLIPVYYGILTPVSLILRLRGADPLDMRIERERSSYWVDAGHKRPKVRYFNQFTDERYAPGQPGGSNPILALVTFLLWVIALDAALGLGLQAAGVDRASPLDYRATSVVYEGADWAAPMFREYAAAKARYAPFVGWRRRPTPETNEHIRIDATGRRVTVGGDMPVGRPIEVAFFGGSTVWGLGSRDEGTLPSAFQRQARAAGYPVHVTNLGEDGYVQWQEVLTLEDLLARGEVPDVAIFYDGVNDVFAHFQDPAVGQRERVHQNEARWRAWFEGTPSILPGLMQASALRLLGGKALAPAQAERPRFPDLWPHAEGGALQPTPEEAGRTVGERYMQSARHLARIAEAYGFELVVAWQPSVFTKGTLHEEETHHAVMPGQDVPEKERTATFDAKLGRLYVAAHEGVAAPVLDLADTFADRAEATYIDWCHVSEEGNAILARRFLEHVAPALERRRAPRRPPHAAF